MSNGQHVLHIKVIVKAPISLNKKLAKATLFVSTNTDPAKKGSYSELYGCRWKPNESQGACASAVGNKTLQEWHNSTFDKSTLKIKKMPALWISSKPELNEKNGRTMVFKAKRKYE